MNRGLLTTKNLNPHIIDSIKKNTFVNEKSRPLHFHWKTDNFTVLTCSQVVNMFLAQKNIVFLILKAFLVEQFTKICEDSFLKGKFSIK